MPVNDLWHRIETGARLWPTQCAHLPRSGGHLQATGLESERVEAPGEERRSYLEPDGTPSFVPGRLKSSEVFFCLRRSSRKPVSSGGCMLRRKGIRCLTSSFEPVWQLKTLHRRLNGLLGRLPAASSLLDPMRGVKCRQDRTRLKRKTTSG